MLSFSPTEEQEEIRQMAHSVALDHLRPQGRSSEHAGDISPALMQTLAQTGLTSPFPEAYGGSGSIEALTYALIAEELGFGDGSLALNIIGSLMAPVSVALAGNKDQCEKYISPFGYGPASERGSFAFAERTGGYTLAEVSAVARRDGQDYLITGVKRSVIHGSQASLRIVLARLEGSEDLRVFVLPSSSVESLEIVPETNKLGLLSAPSAAYTLNDVRVPSDMLLDEAFGAVRAATLYCILRAGVACGTARAALEYSSKYAEERIAFGRPIVSYQGIAFILAEMAMKLDAARLLLWNAATLWDQASANDAAVLVREAEAAQFQALKIGKAATIDAVQVMGGAGFMQDHPAEMWMRNVASME